MKVSDYPHKHERESTRMKEYGYSSKFIETAVMLSRLYGVAETLNPLNRMDDDKFHNMICRWTDEYLKSNSNDILTFFEEKISLYSKSLRGID